MNEAMINKAIGGALTVLVLYVLFIVIRFAWRLVTRAARSMPESLESAARIAGSATAKAERSASKAVQAFKAGRRGD